VTAKRQQQKETAAQAEAGSIAVVVTTSVTSLANVACQLAIALRSAAFLGLFLPDLDCLIHDLGIIDINFLLCSNTGRLKPGCHRQWFG